MSQFLSFCSTCDKAFTRENSFKRHISYCRRTRAKPKVRATSCNACSTAKTKCSFERPKCAKCLTKGIDCVYDNRRKTVVAGNVRGIPQEVHEEPVVESNVGLLGISSHDVGPYDDDFEVNSTMSIILRQDQDIHEWNDQIPLFDEADFANFDRNDHTTLFSPLMGQVSPRASFDRHVVPNSPLVPPALKTLPLRNAAARYGVQLAMNIIRAFPQMMLRRETFPPFIHPLWHLPSLPERLAVCMSIAQLFVSRTPETRPFIWRSIKAEEERMRNEMETFSKYDFQYAIQAVQIYLIMAVVDQDSETAERGARILCTVEILSEKFRSLLDRKYISTAEKTHPSFTWEDWIFEESLRRKVCLCFLIGRIVSIRARQGPCPLIEDFRDLPVCSARTMWEARSREEWETERSFHELGTLNRDMWSFGALMDAHQNPSDAMSAIRLDAWNAGTDQLGTLMNIAVSLV